MLKCVENCGSRHPPKRVPWARCQKNFQTYFIHINFHICNICKPKSFTALLILYLFFDYLLSTFPKKWKLKNGPRLPTRLYSMIMLVILVCESLKRRIERVAHIFSVLFHNIRTPTNLNFKNSLFVNSRNVTLNRCIYRDELKYWTWQTHDSVT